jgi:hypothetical protein
VRRHAFAQDLGLTGVRWEIYRDPPDVEVEIFWLVAPGLKEGCAAPGQ